MTEATQGPALTMTGDREFTEAEIEAFERDDLLEDPAVSADQYPRLWNVSAGMIYQRVLRALEPSPPEYVTVSLPRWGRTDVELDLAIAKWNMMWEAAQYRRRVFSDERKARTAQSLAEAIAPALTGRRPLPQDPLGGRSSHMSAPTPGNPRQNQAATWRRLSAAANPECQADAGRWATIRYALDSNGRTVRLCAITLVAGVPPAVITLLLGLHH